jgi:hypothetical protein
MRVLSIKKSKALRGSERGQAMTEYIILVILIAIVTIPILKLFPDAVRGYVRPFYYSISRPLP